MFSALALTARKVCFFLSFKMTGVMTKIDEDIRIKPSSIVIGWGYRQFLTVLPSVTDCPSRTN